MDQTEIETYRNVLQDLKYTIVEIFPDPDAIQKNLISSLLAVNLHQIIKGCTESVIEKLVEENGFDITDTTNGAVIIETPRRIGKTRTQAAVVAALFICIKNFQQVHLSLTLELGQMFLEYVRWFMEKCDRGRKLLSCSESKLLHLHFISSDKSDDRRISILSLHCGKSRGFHADSIMIDEVDPSSYLSIMKLHSKENTFSLAIVSTLSSPLPDVQGIYDKLMALNHGITIKRYGFPNEISIV